MTETMQEIMAREKAEAIASLKLANSALSRIFGIEEEEDKGCCGDCGSIIDFSEEGGHIYPDGSVVCPDCEGN